MHVKMKMGLLGLLSLTTWALLASCKSTGTHASGLARAEVDACLTYAGSANVATACDSWIEGMNTCVGGNATVNFSTTCACGGAFKFSPDSTSPFKSGATSFSVSPDAGVSETSIDGDGGWTMTFTAGSLPDGGSCTTKRPDFTEIEITGSIRVGTSGGGNEDPRPSPR